MTDSSDKDAYTKALNEQDDAATLRKLVTQFAGSAVRHGVDRDWANGWLRSLGAAPIAGENIYKVNVKVTGDFGRTIKAATRADALRIFQAHVARINGDGKITPQNCDDRIYHVQFGDEPVFASGPEDPSDSDTPELTLDELKTNIRVMLMQGVAEQNWGYRWAQSALDHMGLPQMPKRTYKTVEVPVSVSAPVTITAFEGDDDATLTALAARKLAQLSSVSGKPVEIGDGVVVTETKSPDGDDSDLF